MTILFAMIAALALAGALAYKGVSLRVWTSAAAAYVAALALVGIIGGAGLAAALLIGVPVVLVFNIVAWRRTLVTKPIFAAFKNVLPPMSDTEREALEAGDVWWEGEMFRGRPDWSNLIDFQRTRLTAAEQSFLDNETEQLCTMLDDWEITQELVDLPESVWNYIHENRFFAMLIPEAHGGLGFSALAQSTIVAKIGSRSITAAVTIMVPNSLGPGELLVHYGTAEQQKRWLPGLADGTEVPCFGLTGPEAGSDAGAIPDTGTVCYGQHEGERVLGLKMQFSKRWITLAPVATVVGLAFKAYDPDGLLGDKPALGITCALVPADHPGIEIGKRHFPGAFQNGPIYGKDVFIPLDWIIGGPEMAGRGWRMLVECLSAGRGISLPALASAGSKMCYRMTGAYARVRRQFKTPIGKFEGVQEASARIAGINYKMEATRVFTASGVDHCAPSVVTAIAKYHMTEWMRETINHAMDIHGGRGIQHGPRNYLAAPYQTIPVAITVEGANILTRSLMIFGQGAIRCHPYVFAEMEAARADDLDAFDQAFWGHIGYSVNRGARALILGLTGSRLATSPKEGATARYFRELTRMSAALAFVADVTMAMLGGDLKRKERLSARLGDVLSNLYFASATLKFYIDEGEREDDLPHMQWALEDCLGEIDRAFHDFFRNFPNLLVGRLLRLMVFPLGRVYSGPTDALAGQIAATMMEPGEFRDRLTADIYVGKTSDDATGRMEITFQALAAIEPQYNLFTKAVAKGDAVGATTQEQLAACVANGLLSQAEADQVAEYDALRYDAILTDAFEAGVLSGSVGKRRPKDRHEAPPASRVA